MRSKVQQVWFIRGLNTYGDELQHFGPLTFGAIAKPLTRQLAKAQIELIPVEGLGNGNLKSHIENAQRTIVSHPRWPARDSESRTVHLLGHSMGGLIARALAHQDGIADHLASVVTLGTPHRGTAMADHVLRMSQTHGVSEKIMAAFGYDISSKQICYNSLTQDSCQEFNRCYPNRDGVLYASIVGAAECELQALPYRLMNRLFPETQFREPNDGLVEASSQSWGQILGTFDLDHLMEIGFCLDFRTHIRANFVREQRRMIQALLDFWCATPI